MLKTLEIFESMKEQKKYPKCFIVYIVIVFIIGCVLSISIIHISKNTVSKVQYMSFDERPEWFQSINVVKAALNISYEDANILLRNIRKEIKSRFDWNFDSVSNMVSMPSCGDGWYGVISYDDKLLLVEIQDLHVNDVQFMTENDTLVFLERIKH